MPTPPAQQQDRASSPTTYLGTAVPDDIKAQWHRWEAAHWRRMRHMAANDIYPPDQPFSVRPPAGMCRVHHQQWIAERDRMYNPRTGHCWPGFPGSPFRPVDRDLNCESEPRRCDWDRKAAEQMQQVEAVCLSGRSPQCSNNVPVWVPRPPARRTPFFPPYRLGGS
ncbi:hypothetical protein ACIQU4_28650 [Streptomyces sp. NPDC090741]|uniref:hypothetical protein n=1 Tax=Streptomyces sp. NPDC090741 TaxID=3365967 RepID=UPI00380DE37F